MEKIFEQFGNHFRKILEKKGFLVKNSDRQSRKVFCKLEFFVQKLGFFFIVYPKLKETVRAYSNR